MKTFTKQFTSKKYWFYFSILFFLAACEKPQVEPPQTNAIGQQAVGVLNDGSGFDSVLNIVKNVAGVSNLLGDIGLYDFTVESNTNLNFVWYSWFPSQQDNVYGNARLSYNTVSKMYIPLPSGANSNIPNINNQDKISYSYFFKPYSNFFNYCALRTTSTGSQTLQNSTFAGDVSATIPSSYDIIGEPDMGYLFPMMNTQRFPGNINYDARKGCLTQGLFPQNNVNLYLFKVCNPYKFNYQFSTNPGIPKIVANLLDISIVNKGLSQSKYKDMAYTFDLRSDSLFAHHIMDSTMPQTGYVVQVLSKITGISVAPGLSNNSNIKTIRHYSTDGKILGMFFQDLTTKKCWTYSFNYTTHTFTKGIENATLDYSADGSDIDIDEYGNAYYSGIAGNGSNANGVSIYKKDISGAVSLIGSDNILKYGEIIQLKHLFGKVYLVVKGKISGTNYKQLTFIKQQ